MGFSKNRDSQRAEMYEKKVSDRVASDTLILNDTKIMTVNGEEILERLRKVELQLDQLQLKANQLSSTLSQLCIQAIKEKFKAE